MAELLPFFELILLYKTFRRSTMQILTDSEFISIRFDEAGFLKLTDFRGQSASVHAQIVCQLLTIVWNRKGVTLMCFGFGQKKGNQLISGRTFGSDFDFLVIKNIFGSNYFHKIENNLTVESAGIIAGCQDAVAVNEQNGCVICCHHIYR